jgi:phospholipid/cholesterol/gamma-HCH transport system substrate-binding protein
MTKQAPSIGRILVMVTFTLSCFGLLLFLWLSFGGSIPLKPNGYRFEVAFPEATQLGVEADVRIAGVSVGKVRAKATDPAHPNRTVATIEMQSRYAPVARDTRAILRQKSLLGETFVELTPGHPKQAGTVPEGGFLADGRVADTVQLDEILNSLDPETRASFRGWQQDLSRAVAGRGRDLNDALGNLPQFAEDGNDLLTLLDAQSESVRGLVRGTGEVFGALTKDEGQLHDLIVNAGDTFDATARQQDALAESLRIFPTFLDESKLTFQRLERFSQDTDPLVQDLRPAAQDLTPTLRDLRALAPDLRTTFTNLDPLISASRTGMPALRDTLSNAKPLVGQLEPFLQELNPILQWLEYNQLTTADFISNGAATLADTTDTVTNQEMGHYLRQFGPIGPDSVAMYPTRPAASRGNAYLRPDALTGEKRDRYMMFGNFDCNNAGGQRMTAVPDTNDAPSCFVQDPPAWPPGNTRPYPHIDAADYSKR